MPSNRVKFSHPTIMYTGMTRGTVGGGVFIMVEKSITSVEQTYLITDGEIDWV